MAISRTCGSCGKTIEQRRHLELQLRVLDPRGPEEQDEKAGYFDDYCDTCIVSGKAVADALAALEPKYRVRRDRAKAK